MHHLTKDITIFLDERTVYSDEALEMISRAPYDGCSFPLARKITFYFVHETMNVVAEDVAIDPLTSGTNIGAFVERIKQMAPLASEIRVQPVAHNDLSTMDYEHLSGLAFRLYQLASRIEHAYDLDTTDLMWLDLDMICTLSHVSCASTSSVDITYQFIELARKNALTLQSLVLDCNRIDVLGLVQAADDNCMLYPCLLTLKLRSESDTDELR
ncbi:hypothetical protein H4R27_000465 [Coemansia aciculifera]|nr:hypothetical protein H4R27_000465 [Coemansia aciculifera]